MPPRRVHVVGTSGSGKTTVARAIADKLGIRHIELDAINWQPGWTELPKDQFYERVREETKHGDWTIDGNYSAVRDIIWDRVDTIVWLDMPFIPVFLRIVWRTIRRILTQEELWNTNTEKLDALVGKYGMPLWVIQTHEKRRKEYPPLLANPKLSHVDIKVFKSLREVNAWIESLGD
ncbi:AAA family ATPase [Candidatus Bathyarchaeota archaeon]|nr:AAA family ATPase [Candidatus Bathyarchaeota archaeon]MBT4319985.1 AAA family ATPase [Candidatus Bathyarchaeota archaeon]MBT4423906.1 AAA family ATPase [Candidatus Bathyarchaeota archaeon]MBT6604951.1 AAA family ATPase [Candidatus Bathyarchaeota archaeon]MBT7187504.1 AAA family ATPase [Candidatus Bathyarchaeota archaeon]